MDPNVRPKVELEDPRESESDSIRPQIKVSESDFVGKKIGQNFEVESLLGEGGMSTVYKAHHIYLQKPFAVKVLRTDKNFTESDLKRFNQEAKAVSGLNHPNIVRLYEFGVLPEGAPYQAIDYVEGQTLSQAIATHGKLSSEKVIDYMIQCCDGLSHAHSAGIVHRDIKPSNIVLSSDSSSPIKIIDFGIAKVSVPSGETITQTGDICGSPPYMSPEQCMGYALDKRSDIYSLGCTMYEALSGKKPFDKDNPIQIIFAHINNEPDRFADALKINKGLERVILHCMEKDPNNRYQSAGELKKDLELVKQGLDPTKRAVKKGKAKKPVNIPFIVTSCLVATIIVFIAAKWPLIAPTITLYIDDVPPILQPFLPSKQEALATQAILEAHQLAKSGQLQLAEDRLKPFTKIPGELGERTMQTLAWIYALDNKPDEAAKLCYQLGGSEKGMADNLHSTGYFLDSAGNPQAAIPLWKRAAQLYEKLSGNSDPKYLKAMFNIGSAEQRLGHMSQALAIYDEILPKLKDATGYSAKIREAAETNRRIIMNANTQSK